MYHYITLFHVFFVFYYMCRNPHPKAFQTSDEDSLGLAPTVRTNRYLAQGKEVLAIVASAVILDVKYTYCTQLVNSLNRTLS